MTPKEYDDNQKLLYCCGQRLKVQSIRKLLRALPVKISCDSYLMASEFIAKRSYFPIIEVRPFPTYQIKKVIQNQDYKGGRYDFEQFNRGTNEITKVNHHSQTFYFFRDTERKAYQIAQKCMNELEKTASRLKLDEKHARNVIDRFKNINSKLYNYLACLDKMNCEKWIEFLDNLSKNNPKTYEDFMRKSLTPIEIRYLEELNKNKTKLNEFFKFGPKNESQVRQLFDRFHHLFGYRIVLSREAYPDYILCKNGIEIRTEAEFHSSRFIQHRHDPKDCDMIVCWEHDLHNNDLNLDVFELGTGKLYKRDGTIEDIVVRP